MESKKNIISSSGRKPNEKSPKGENNHEEVLVSAVKESPMAIVLLV